MSLVSGFHHVTVCASGAQEDVDFLTQVFGQRLIKQTVLFDGRYAHYHLYYSNANAEPGSVYTTFPYKRVPGRPGSGQIQSTAYTVKKGATKFWDEHLTHHKVKHSGIQERFGQKFIRFNHPSGLQLEVIEDSTDERKPWTVGEVSADVATHGFHGPVLSVREIPETERFFVDALGFKKTGVEGNYHRLELNGGGANRTIILLHEPDRPSGSWGFGAGCAHHVALDAGTDEGLAEQKGDLRRAGLHGLLRNQGSQLLPLHLLPRPGGILVECAATAEGGFARDEPYDALGHAMLLPPWFEERRDEIMAMLEPITIPENNFPTHWKRLPCIPRHPVERLPPRTPSASGRPGARRCLSAGTAAARRSSNRE
jgi:glyoxalase family protein